MKTRHSVLLEHVHRLAHVVRSVMMKRALTAVDPKPRLNFWRLIHGNQMDIAVIEWCKVFGSDKEATHWKNVIPSTEHDQFRAALLGAMGVPADAWTAYWKEMKTYRDNLAAHHNGANNISNYPHLDLALRSSYFYYGYLIKELRSLGDQRFPDDLEEYCGRFEAQARDIAEKAITATANLEERVD